MNIVINKHVWFQYQEKYQQGYQNIRQTYGDYAIGSIISKRLQSKRDTPNNLNSAIKKNVWSQHHEKYQQGNQNIRQTYGDYVI